jgi:hypothetical protein
VSTVPFCADRLVSSLPPQVLQKMLSSSFELPHIAQRTSDGADISAPQLLQNLLLALLGYPQCEQ